MTSAADADVGTINHNEKVAIPLRTVGIEMGHPQGPIPAKTDNNTADGFFKKKYKTQKIQIFWHEVSLDEVLYYTRTIYAY